MGQVPAGDKPRADVSFDTPAAEVRARLGDGSFGGPYQVADEIMQEFFNVLVAEAAQLLQTL